MTRKSVLIAFLWLPGTALAQDDSVELDRIVVTASRTPIGLSETGSAVSVITREEIERRQSIVVSDLLRSVPGLAVSRSGSLGTQTQIRLRGAEANHVLVMIDGVEANDPTAGDEFQFEHLAAYGIERIEVVRGPQSALWGSDAVGGVINIVTRDPQAPSAAAADLEAGSLGTTRFAGRLDIADGQRQLRMGLAYLDSDGFDISRNGDERDGYRNATANVSGRWDVSARLALDLAARHTDTTTELDAVDLLVTGLPADADRVSESAQSYLMLGATLSPDNPFEHAFKLTYLDTGSDHLEAGAWQSALDGRKLGLYYQASAELGSDIRGTLTLALDHEREDFEQRGVASPFGDPNQDQRLETTGYVLEYRFAPLERLTVSSSVRYDESTAFDSVTTYRLSGAYALRADTRLRASFGTGHKSPTFIERFGFFPEQFLGNARLEPEESRGWEIGIDRSFSDDRLSLSATYFDEELENEIDGFAFDAAALKFTAVNLEGVSRRRGIELSASAALSEALRLTASSTLLDSTQPDGTGRQVREIRRPERTAALTLSYAPTPLASVNLDVAYNGPQYDTFFPPFPQPQERVTLSGYTLVTLAARVAVTERLELFGRIENLLDEDYEDVYGFATPGRSAYLGVRTRR